MSVPRSRTPRAALLALTALLVAVPVLGAAAGSSAGSTAPARPGVVAAADTTTVVTRLSSTRGVAGDRVMIKGTGLASAAGSAWVARTVRFGTVAVATDRVTALSDGALVVEVPPNANGPYVVTVGDAVKGPKFTYAAPFTITTTQAALDALAPALLSETGLAGATLAGANLTRSTKVVVGGKSAKVDRDGLAPDGRSLTFAYPVGLVGIQDVVVTDSGVTRYVGHVTYRGTPVALNAVPARAYVERATSLQVTGTRLDLVASVTYNGAKASFKRPAKGVTDALTVTIPAGAAVAGGDLVVTTRYGASATADVDRVPAPVPTVTGVAPVPSGAAGEVTLTGTDLLGLAKVTVTTADGRKSYAGSRISVTSATSAKVTLPALPPGAYRLVVTAISATPSAAWAFTVPTP